jgi:hypothetical protein
VLSELFARFKVTAASLNTDAKLLFLQLRGNGDEGDDDEAEPHDDVPFFQSLGLSVRPVVQATLRTLGYRHGEEIWGLKLWDRDKHPTDLEEGETRLYGAGEKESFVRIKGNGDIGVKPKSDQLVILGTDDPDDAEWVAGGESLHDYLNDLRNTVNDIKSALNTLKSDFNSHMHMESGSAGPYPIAGTTQGPITPSSANPPADADEPDIKSAVVKVKK